MRSATLLAVAVWALSPAVQANTNLPPSPIKQFWGGGRHTMALLADGSVWTWGSDVSGKLAAPPAAAITLAGARRLADGSFQFAFTNNPGAPFTVLTATNPALPLTNWASLSGVTEVLPGQFQFADPQATNGGRRFYRVSSP